MNAIFTALYGAFRAECIQLYQSPALIALTLIQAVTFLFLVSLFGMTGSRAPTALIDNDQGIYAKQFISNLEKAHHSFKLFPMDATAASNAIRHGKLVAAITIPQGFSAAIANGKTVSLSVIVDNIDADMTDDIQRALPSAITEFGKELHLPGIHVQTHEVDLIGHDTGFIEYLAVSALVLDALIISGILSAAAVAREFELRTAKLIYISPIHPIIPLLGRIIATNLVAMLAMLLTVCVVIFGYEIIPLHPLEMLGTLFVCIIIFSFIGAALGAAMKRTLPVASLLFGISLPLYLMSGSIEPQRFDGNLIWTIAHFSPTYYAVGILEYAVHGLNVTPESIAVNFAALGAWALLALGSILFFVRRKASSF